MTGKASRWKASGVYLKESLQKVQKLRGYVMTGFGDWEFYLKPHNDLYPLTDQKGYHRRDFLKV
jgi:hypothetical protein